jgi:hypothetical protein
VRAKERTALTVLALSRSCSEDKVRLVEELLVSYGLESYRQDKPLLAALSNPLLQAVTKEQVFNTMTSLKLRVVSSIPSALMNPYGS